MFRGARCESTRRPPLIAKASGEANDKICNPVFDACRFRYRGRGRAADCPGHCCRAEHPGQEKTPENKPGKFPRRNPESLKLDTAQLFRRSRSESSGRGLLNKTRPNALAALRVTEGQKPIEKIRSADWEQRLYEFVHGQREENSSGDFRTSMRSNVATWLVPSRTFS